MESRGTADGGVCLFLTIASCLGVIFRRLGGRPGLRGDRAPICPGTGSPGASHRRDALVTLGEPALTHLG